MTNEEIARRGFEAALTGDLEAVKDLLDPEVRWHGGDPDAPGACRNRQEALAFMGRAVQNRRLGDLVDVRSSGERVVVILRPRALPGEEPPDLVANLTTFRNGKAVEMVHYPRVADALAALSRSD